MLFKTVGIANAETAFGFYTNSEGSTIAIDSVVALYDTTPDGNAICAPNTNFLDLVIGVADAAIVNGDIGRVQTYGYRATSICYIQSTSYAAGCKMVPIAGAVYLNSVAAGDGRDGLFALLEDVVSSAATTTISKKIFIRCM